MDRGRIGCFDNLTNEVPKWLQGFELLAQNVEHWRLRQPGGQTISQPRRLRHSSTESMRPIEGTPVNRQHTSLGHKSTAAGSHHGGGASRTPSRKIVVVHYDSEIQKQVEELVRGISIGRGYVRREMMAARVASCSPLSVDSVMPSRHSPRQGVSALSRNNSGPDLVEKYPNNSQDCSATALKEVDTALLDAQRLCEQVAHQLLRDGDCDDDLAAINNCFQEISRICEEQIIKLPAERPSLNNEQDNGEKQKYAMFSTAVGYSGSFPTSMKMKSLDVNGTDGCEELHSFAVPGMFAAIAKC
ncbi:hypothetical protein BDV97DRAFT_215495 [Delphinella strobiligena]|nr:hypothetical protein BDV97DRAFT_215495 [Delphinella strobiligena]